MRPSWRTRQVNRMTALSGSILTAASCSSLCRVSDGRSRHSQKSLCRHSADDRGTAVAARCIDSVMRSVSRIPSKTGGKVRLDDGKFGKFSVRLDFGTSLHSSQTCPRRSGLANNHEQTQSRLQSAFIWRMSAQLFCVRSKTKGEMRLDDNETRISGARRAEVTGVGAWEPPVSRNWQTSPSPRLP